MTNLLILLRCLFAITLLACRMSVIAQRSGSYESISTTQGLSQGMIFTILQDKEGFLWIGTKNGLNRYDGYTFKVFSNDPYESNSLSGSAIVALYEDSKGRIWVGTQNAGLNVYDKKSGKFKRIIYDANNPASISGNNIINCITELSDGRVVVPVYAGGINVIKISDDFISNKEPALITRLSLPDNVQPYAMGKDAQGSIWIGGLDNQVYKFDPLKNSFTKLNDGRLYNNGYVTEDGNVWINNTYFLWDNKNLIPLFDSSKLRPGNIILKDKYDLASHFHDQLSFYDISKWLPGEQLQWNTDLPQISTDKLLFPFLIDHSGILWAGTKGYGLRKYKNSKINFRFYASGFSVRYIVPYGEELLLGAYPYDWRNLKKDTLEKNYLANVLPTKEIDNIIVSKSGEHWIRTDDAGLFSYQPYLKTLKHYRNVNFNNGHGDKQPLLEDKKGNIWFPAFGQVTRINPLLNKIDSFKLYPSASAIATKDICTALYEDAEGLIRIGTEQGFVTLDFRNNNNHPKISWKTNSPADRNSLNYNHVSSFLDDPIEPSKYLWIGTKGGGLNRMNKVTGDFIHLTSKDNLPNDVVYGILSDDQGNIWGSSNKGIFCMTISKNDLDKQTFSFRNFTIADGLQDDEFNTGAFAKLPTGELAFGGVNGLNVFDPKEILVKGYMPDIYITGILVNNQPLSTDNKLSALEKTVELAKEITLTHLQDVLTLEFSALDFTAPGQNKYRYQLMGVDKGWVESGSRRTANYLHLPPGSYVFKVQGSNSQGIWSNKIAELKITVLPPWWKTWWAYLCYFLLASLIIRGYFIFTINREKLKSQLTFEQTETKRAKELDTFKTQLYTNITHEFRTPLTVILGMAQQVTNDPQKYLENGMTIIKRNGESLLNLVNEMLDLSKLQTGKMSLQLVNGDIINFLRYVVESFQSLATSQKKQLHFLSEIDSMHVDYDPEKMRKIISNLLSNALKFTSENANIYISVTEKSDSDLIEKTLLIIKVKDTGIGIPENEIGKIFERFYQSEKAAGSGIGLALTKELVNLMNGDITVKSPPAGASKGSEFTLTLPYARKFTDASEVQFGIVKIDDNPSIETVNEVDNLHPVNKPLLLLVEDNADVVAYTASCLSDHYRLAVGKNGNEGFEIAINAVPDLIITDVMMPVMDGFELCRKLRNDVNTSHIPIIMLTAKADIESKIEGLEQGADAYLQKPFNREELLVRIKKLLELRNSLHKFYNNKNIDAAIVADGNIDVNKLILQSKSEDPFIVKVRGVIESNICNTNFSVEDLCKSVFMSHSQLHRKLEALTGCSPNKFIRIIRLKKAQYYLKNSTDSIASIALDCGYNDPGYFARIFKQEFDLTPQAWRARPENAGKNS